ncbi:MAG: HEAT repeat domain-containing protein [Sedimentisphaerales bacterium]|nr:HEAT repeat domain-containing protein [Sedimentisphaerales bacterium]
MTRIFSRLSWVLLVFVIGGALQDSARTAERQYAPDRKADILHVTIDVTPDFKQRTVAGTTTIRFAPIAEPLTELRLDAIDLDVSSVTSDAKIEGYDVTDKAITITFDPAIPLKVETEVNVVYEAEPKHGLYFRTPEMGYPEEDTHLFTQGESHLAPHWYPNYDYPNEQSTTEVICRVPEGMTVVSNGRLVSEQMDSASGLKVVTWRQDKPHVNYLVALVAGQFKKIESTYRDIPIAFYTPASLIEYAENSFKDTADMLGFFEKEIGVPYPWNKYDQAVVCDFVAGGMENTTLTILTENTLHTNETETIRSSQGLVAHEMIHQWFGDYVTCKDWSHLWLNEGFAVYYEKLYDGHRNGRDAMLYNLYGISRGVLRDRSEHKPIVTRSYHDADEQFDYRAYQKGGWVLHMLRTELGEEMFRTCIKTYLERHALTSVVTEDLRSVIEELTGRSYDRFFDQWIFHGRHPDLKVDYEWSHKDKLAKISVEQTHKVTDEVMLFHFRTKVRFVIDRKVYDREIVVDSKQHDFYFRLPGKPEIIRFDPEYGLLANVTFNKPAPLLYAQLACEDDVIGRLKAADALAKKKDKKTVAELKKALNNDPFYGVRQRASAALEEIHTDEAFEALAESLDQTDARVRQDVVRHIGNFYRPESLELTRKVLRTEKNPAILEGAIRNLGCYHHQKTRRLLVKYIRSRSFRNELAGAAVGAIRRLDEPFFIGTLQQILTEREQEFRSWDFASGLETLARISRSEQDKTKVREFLIGYVNHPKETVQAGAIRALGVLGDERAIPVLETFSGDEPDDRIERAAERALKDLRDRKELIPNEIIQLRETVDKLRKETDKLKNDLDDIKKRMEAGEKATENDDNEH